MSHLFREAVGEAQGRYDRLLSHLALIRDVVELGKSATSFEDLAARLAEYLVTDLGHERVAVVAGREHDALAVVGSYSQSRRFGGAAEPNPVVFLTLARDVMTERALLRWGGEGVGQRRPLPEGLEGAVIGFPLVIGGECRGAVLCQHLVPLVWDLVSQRALELVGEIVAQVVTLTQIRLSMTDIQRHIEAELGDTRTRVVDQAQTLRTQAERIGDLASELTRSNRAKSTFLALMSHELRTPLSVILGFGAILGEGLAGPVTSQQAEYLGRIFANARYLQQLVEDMLFFVDAETVRITPSATAVDLAALVREVTAAMPKSGAPDGPALSVAIAPGAATLHTDPNLLRRILFHVVGNAFKFTERGEVRIEAVRSSDDTATEIRVTDTGIGILPDQLGRIFELFQQGDDSHTRKHDGVGLGLSLVRACLALLHGRCRVVPGARGGTHVELWLPDYRMPGAEASTHDAVATAAAERAAR